MLDTFCMCTVASLEFCHHQYFHNVVGTTDHRCHKQSKVLILSDLELSNNIRDQYQHLQV